MKNYVNCYWKRMASSSLCELVELFGEQFSWPDLQSRREYRDRIFNPWRTFWIFLGQVLSTSQTCVEALRKAQVWICLGDETISSNTAGFCKARMRLEQACLDKINHEVIERQQSKVTAQTMWCGRHVGVVDGTSVSMPDTEENQKLYPQPKGQKKGCGFPVMKIVAVFSLVTGIMLSYRKGNLHVHERILWQDIWDCHKEGDVVLGDRAFCSYATYWLLRQKNVDCVMRLHQARKEKEIVKKFNKNDYIVQW